MKYNVFSLRNIKQVGIRDYFPIVLFHKLPQYKIAKQTKNELPKHCIQIFV